MLRDYVVKISLKAEIDSDLWTEREGKLEKLIETELSHSFDIDYVLASEE